MDFTSRYENGIAGFYRQFHTVSHELALAIEMDNRADVGWGNATTDSDTEADVAADMAEKARASQEALTERLGDERRTEIVGDEA